MGGKRILFNAKCGFDSFDELLIEILKGDKYSIKEIVTEFSNFDNRVNWAFVNKMLNKFFREVPISCFMTEEKGVIRGNTNKRVTTYYGLIEEATKIPTDDLMLLTNINQSSYDIFVQKYPDLKKQIKTEQLVNDYDEKPEVNLPPKESLCEIIIYCLYHKGQLRICDIVKIIDELYETGLYSEKDVMKCFRSMFKKMIFNLLSKLDITHDGRYTYFLKKQVFSDKVKYEELKELCDVTNIDDPRIIEFMEKYKQLRRYFVAKTQVKLLSHDDLSKNHLVEMIFFLLLLDNINPFLSFKTMYEKISELDRNLARKYDEVDIEGIFNEFYKRPIRFILLHTVLDGEDLYSIREKVISNKITINDLFDLYLTDRGAIENFCDKYPELRNLFPVYDILSPTVQEIQESSVINEKEISSEITDTPNESVGEATCVEGVTSSSFEGKIDGKFERTFGSKTGNKTKTVNTESDQIDTGKDETVSVKDIPTIVEGILKDISSDRINVTINITVNGNLIVNT